VCLATVLAAVALTAGCSGPSSYNSSAEPPQAVANLIGTKPTSGPGLDPVAATVRSLSQVTLTGNASNGGAASIGSFAWAQTDAAPTPQVTLLYLDSDTVTFTAPTVASDTTLHFTLTVTTADNVPATAHVVLLVKAAADSNEFLSQLPAPHYFKVAVATQEGLGPLATPAASLGADVPICVTISRTIDYIARDTTQHSVSLTPLQADGTWAASIGGAAGDTGSYTNPRVAFAIPALNQDDIAVLYNNPVPGESSSAAATRLAAQLVPSDIDLAHLSLSAVASAGSCDGKTTTTDLAAKTMVIHILDQGGNPVGSATPASAPGVSAMSAAFTPDMLVSQTPPAPPSGPAPTSQYETADTARAYYDAIDPSGAKKTLSGWLNANCFNTSAADYGADAHAVYTNNYDLGFGRDMYFAACKAGGPGKPGDMAWIVFNYASVEAAASKLNPIIAVAMEYSAATDGSNPTRRFPKFYVFAPNDRDGSFERVLSSDFDHRGEKYVPGTCVACHGGVLPQFPANFSHVAPTDPPYPTIPDPTQPTPSSGTAPQLGLGDVDSAFMPWDLDSFLYSDTDPAFVGLSVNKALFTRAAQEPFLKQLNQSVYCTYQPEIETIGSNPPTDRFQSSRRLLAQWYGGTIAADGSAAPDSACAQSGVPTASLLPNSYSDSATPAGWTQQTAPGSSNATTLTSDQIYHQVLARNCRSCHTQNATISDQFSDYPSFIHEFQAVQPTGTPPPPAVPGLGVLYAFKQARMPLARLTLDRFWVDYAGGAGAATILATHVQQVNAETDLVDASSGDAIGPGLPIVNATVNGSAASAVSIGSNASGAVLKRYAGARADALSLPAPGVDSSYFTSDFSWTLCLVPPSGNSCAAQSLAGPASALPAFSTDATGTYELSLVASNALGGTTTQQFNYTVNPTPPKLVAANCPPTTNAPINTPTSVNLGPMNLGGDGCIVPGDGLNVLQIQVPGTPNWVTPSATAPIGNSNWQAYVSGYTINFEYLMAPTAPVALNYQVVDVDGLTATSSTGITYLYLSNLAPLTISLHLINPLGVVPAANSSGAFTISTNLLLQGIPAVEVSSLTLLSNATSGSVTPASITPSQSFTYTMPSSSPVICDVNGQSISNIANACSGDPFTYTLSVGATTLSSASVMMQVLATTSFWQSAPSASSGVYGYLGGTGCASCHDSADAPSTPTDHWIYTDSNSLATYDSIMGITANVTSAPTVVTPGNPVASALYTNPCLGTNGHGTNGTTAQQLSAQQCSVLMQWILEGANYD
jgi:mono/diheme cytochrome c family protein